MIASFPAPRRFPTRNAPASLVALAGALLLGVVLPPVSAAQSDPWPLPTTTPAAAGFSTERLQSLHDNLGDRLKSGAYSGYVMLLARDGQIVDWSAHGWRNVAAQEPMRPDSIIKIYSMSKVMTSVAILMLLEEDKLHLGDPVEKFLPQLANRQVLVGGTADAPQLEPAQRPFTVRELLTHTAGYYYDAEWSAGPVAAELMRRAKVWEVENLAGFVDRIATLPLHEQPGTRYRYGVNTDLLGAIVEVVSGQTLDAFLAERLFAPLGLRDTGFYVPPEKRDRMATVYERGPDGALRPSAWGNQELVRGDGTGVFSGGGGLYSTAADYARFAQMLLNRGELDGVRILSRKTVELMTQNHIAHLDVPHPFNIPSQGFGLGVRVVNDLGASTLLGSPGTFGWDGAATTVVHIDPVERTVALLLCQHIPFNQDDIFATFTNGYYSALVD